jgi:hypothetical protein
MRAYDVAEVAPDRIAVSASPDSNGLAYIVEARRDQGNAAQRVASDRVIRAEPFFAASADGSAVYVGEGFLPNSPYKLDATQSTLPIIAEDVYGTISGTDHLSLNADGSRIYTTTGGIFDTASITRIGELPRGLAVADLANPVVYVVGFALDKVGVYDAGTLGRTGERLMPCSLTTVARFAPLSDGLAVLGDDLFCAAHTVPY